MAAPRRVLRKSQTDAERLLWQRLRNRQIANCKFRRQHPFPPFIVDFVCLGKRLIVEIDGGQHVENRESDERRPRFLETLGFRVIPFWNREVLLEPEAVIDKVADALAVAG